MELNRQKLIVDLLTGAKIKHDTDVDLTPRAPKGFGRNALNVLSLHDLRALKALKLHCAITEISGTYVRSPAYEGDLLWVLDELEDESVEQKYIDIVNAIFPDQKKCDQSSSIRVSLFLPTESITANVERNSWVHYHVKPDDLQLQKGEAELQGLTSVINQLDSGFGIRLFAAFHLLGLAKTQFMPKEKAFFPRLIQSANLFPQFEIYSHQKANDLKLYLKLMSGVFDQLYRLNWASKKSRPKQQAKLIQLLKAGGVKLKDGVTDPSDIANALIKLKGSENKYEEAFQQFSAMLETPAMPLPETRMAFCGKGKGDFIFPRSFSRDVLKAPSWQKDVISFVSKEDLIFSSFELPSDNTSKVNKAESVRQKILEGMSYMMSLSSGYIVTLEFQRSTLQQIGENEELLSLISKPALVAPTEMTTMLLDLKDFNTQLDSMTLSAERKPDKRKRKRNQALEMPQIQLRSSNSAPLLIAKGYLEDKTVVIKSEVVDALTYTRRMIFPLPLKSSFSDDDQVSHEYLKGTTRLISLYHQPCLENVSEYQYPLWRTGFVSLCGVRLANPSRYCVQRDG